MISNLINVKNPKTTKPMAKEECERSPSSASPAKFVVFCNLNKINATKDETANIDNETFISSDIDNITPNNAECANVSPKNESLRQTTKHPRGPVTIAIPIPAISALNKKSSNILFHFFHDVTI
jgi:hypothetical protein